MGLLSVTDFLFPPEPPTGLAVQGKARLYPVRRIFCVGRNYAAHAAEMGNTVDREAPFYFTKSLNAVLPSGAELPYPPGTQDLHHEVELGFALGAPLFRADRAAAAGAIYAYGVALDMTRRDLQAQAKDKRRPWDLSKDFEGSAVFASMQAAETFGEVGPQKIWLDVNGVRRQEAALSDMIHDVADIAAHLSGYYHLGPGDVILTGTPAGVGAVGPGDRLEGGIDGLEPVRLTISAPE